MEAYIDYIFVLTFFHDIKNVPKLLKSLTLTLYLISFEFYYLNQVYSIILSYVTLKV